jgi:hypothetical protein
MRAGRNDSRGTPEFDQLYAINNRLKRSNAMSSTDRRSVLRLPTLTLALALLLGIVPTPVQPVSA